MTPRKCYCGHVPIIDQDLSPVSNDTHYYVCCPTCYMCGPGDSSKNDAVKFWNRMIRLLKKDDRQQKTE